MKFKTVAELPFKSRTEIRLGLLEFQYRNLLTQPGACERKAKQMLKRISRLLGECKSRIDGCPMYPTGYQKIGLELWLREVLQQLKSEIDKAQQLMWEKTDERKQLVHKR